MSLTGLQIEAAISNQHALRHVAGNLNLAAGAALAAISANPTPAQQKKKALADGVFTHGTKEGHGRNALERLLAHPDAEPFLLMLTAEPTLLTAQQQADLDAFLKAKIPLIFADMADRITIPEK